VDVTPYKVRTGPADSLRGAVLDERSRRSRPGTLAPFVDRSPAEIYSEHCARRELAYQVDPEGRPVFRPRVGPYTWRVSAGRGTVYSTTVVRPRGEEPRSVVLVDLDEGFRMMSRVVGLAPQDVAIGQRVRLAWDGDVPVFEPDGGPA
jgi:acyl-CoA-associated DUF35 OB-fold domain-containing protein